jgi:hypothetical protein
MTPGLWEINSLQLVITVSLPSKEAALLTFDGLEERCSNWEEHENAQSLI